MRAKITKRSIEAIRPGSRDQFLWDSQLPGFGCKITPRGRRVYIAQTRVNGKIRRVSIGQHGPLTPTEARKQAEAALRGMRAGQNPTAEKRAKREALTVAELWKRFLAEHGQVHKKERSWKEDRRIYKHDIEKQLGGQRVDEVSRTDIGKLLQKMKDTPVAANRTLALLKTMFNLAEREWGLRPLGTNPCQAIKRFKETPRRRYLSPDELGRLGDALTKVERTGTDEAQAVAAIQLLILTGARKNEILSLRWEHVDLERGYLRLADSKTGAKDIPLNSPAAEILEKLAQHCNGSPWVIQGPQPGNRRWTIQREWNAIRAQAKFQDVHIHDLRHSFASVAVGANVSLPVLGNLLGHGSSVTTERYAHLADDPLRKATDEIGSRLAEALDSGRPALRAVK